MLIKNGLVLREDATLGPADVLLIEGRVEAVGVPGSLTGGPELDAAGCYVTPGFIDIHIHGAMGSDFCDGTPEAVETISRYLAREGVTDFLGTTMSYSEEILTGILTNAAGLTGSTLPGRAVLRGVNMEGPFFSKRKKGAQNESYIIDPDLAMFERLFDRSGGAIRLVDVAPELDGALPFIAGASKKCAVSLAHTTAGYDAALAAFEQGASHVTHLFNAMPPFAHRDPGVVGAAWDRARYVEVISDGVHLHPAVVRSVFSWFGPERVCLISDAIRACGMADGQYTLGGQDVTLAAGRATLSDGTIAGSATSLAQCVRKAVSFGVPLGQALRAATLNPARALGLDRELGSVAAGKRANLLLLDEDLIPRRILIDGQPLAI